MLTADSNGKPPHRSVALRGTIEGMDLHRLGEVFEETVHENPGTVILDLSGLESWSLTAQAMTLSAARRLSQHGSELVLCGPSEALMRQSKRLDIFGRVTTRDRSTEPASAGLSKTLTTVALLIIRHRRLLLVRKRGDATLHLPGGTIKRSESTHDALARHVERQLGLELDRGAIEPRMTVHSLSGHKPTQNLQSFCFQADHAGVPTAQYEVSELAWASTSTVGPIHPAAREGCTILQRAGYVD